MGAVEADLYDRESFLQHIRESSEEVKTWPEWKRKMLGEVIPVDPGKYNKENLSSNKKKK